MTDKFKPESDYERGYQNFFILSEQVSFAGFAGVGVRWCPEEKRGGEHTEKEHTEEEKRERSQRRAEESAKLLFEPHGGAVAPF